MDRKLTYLEARLCLIDAYGKTFDIATGDSLAEQSPVESFSEQSVYQSRLEDYIEFRVMELTGISWLEFLNLPRYEIKIILETLAKPNIQEAEAARDAEKILRQKI